jgi:hypothetical protein
MHRAGDRAGESIGRQDRSSSARRLANSPRTVDEHHGRVGHRAAGGLLDGSPECGETFTMKW